MKYYFLLLLSTYSIGAFPGLYEPLYWSEDELLSLSKKGEGYLETVPKKDQKRLKNLKQKQSDIFWHLDDPYVGKKSCENLQVFDKPVSWNFVFDDFLSKNSKKVKIVTIDSVPGENKSKEKFSFQNHSNSSQFCTKSDFLIVSQDELSSLVDFWPKKMKNFEMTHGFQNFHLIKQLAPKNVEIITISIFDENGHANKEQFLRALEYGRDLQPDILLLALKFTTFDLKKNRIDQQINRLLQQFPYIVASAGNSGTSQEAYPAKLDCITFDVGAYDTFHNVCDFSQYEKDIGPKVVAPGKDVVSYGLIPNKSKPQLVMTSGTSVAAAFFTAFLATMLSECSGYLTRKQLLTIIYRCTHQLGCRSLLGCVDMRTCLFACNIVKALQKNNSRIIMQHKKFNDTLEEILLLNNIFLQEKLISNVSNKVFVKKLKCYAFESSLDQVIQLFCEELCNHALIDSFVDNYYSKLLKEGILHSRCMRNRLKYPLSQKD